MPEVGIVLTQEEEAALVKFALSRGARLVPDIQYSERSHAEILTYEDYLRYRRQTRLFFVIHESFHLAHLEMDDIEKGGEPAYFIVQRNGGPSIDFLSTVEFEEAGKRCLNPGFLAYHTTFWNPDTRANEKPPESLKCFFKDLTNELGKISVKSKVGVRTYRIGTSTAELLEHGERELGFAVRSS